MKKKTFFRGKVLVLGVVMCGTAGLASCDSTAWMQFLLPVLQEILKPGSYDNTMQFSGTAKMELYDYNSQNNTFDKDSRRTASVQTTVSVSYNDSICQIKADNLSVGSQQVTQLDFVTYFNPSTMTISADEDYLTGGVCMLNGTANTALDAACFSGKVVNQTLELKTIYFTIGDKLFKGTFQGTQLTE